MDSGSIDARHIRNVEFVNIGQRSLNGGVTVQFGRTESRQIRQDADFGVGPVHIQFLEQLVCNFLKSLITCMFRKGSF